MQAGGVNYYYIVDTDLTNKWLHRLRLSAINNDSRDKLG
jgi:hypothetical protein